MVQPVPKIARLAKRPPAPCIHLARTGAKHRPSPGSRRGMFALILAGAIAIPAFAAPADWDRFQIGSAGQEAVAIEPMPFEKSGSSFPGSAFYYLDSGTSGGKLGEGVHSDADSGDRQWRPDSRPAARSLMIESNAVDRSRALECLTAAVYYEAGSEPDSGQRAVAQVVLNRIAHPAYPNTVCGVVYQGSQRRTGCQFTFTCDGSLARKPNRMFWLRAQGVAQAALGGHVHRPAGLATHYHTIQVNPYWAPSLHYLGTIGAHRFYSFSGRTGQLPTFRATYQGGEPDAATIIHSAVGGESSAALDPVAVQRAYDEGLRRARSAAEQAAGKEPLPAYTPELKARGGDALDQGERLPKSGGIRPEYGSSGKWIVQPET